MADASANVRLRTSGSGFFQQTRRLLADNQPGKDIPNALAWFEWIPCGIQFATARFAFGQRQ